MLFLLRAASTQKRTPAKFRFFPVQPPALGKYRMGDVGCVFLELLTSVAAAKFRRFFKFPAWDPARKPASRGACLRFCPAGLSPLCFQYCFLCGSH